MTTIKSKPIPYLESFHVASGIWIMNFWMFMKIIQGLIILVTLKDTGKQTDGSSKKQNWEVTKKSICHSRPNIRFLFMARRFLYQIMSHIVIVNWLIQISFIDRIGRVKVRLKVRCWLITSVTAKYKTNIFDPLHLFLIECNFYFLY